MNNWTQNEAGITTVVADFSAECQVGEIAGRKYLLREVQDDASERWCVFYVNGRWTAELEYVDDGFAFSAQSTWSERAI